jgi:predicted nucleic acid-binding protein
MFIAAHALAIKAALITDNLREFRKVPRLTVANWLAD